MPCLGSRKKKASTVSKNNSQSSQSSLNQIKQDCQDLKSKNVEYLTILEKQKVELEELKNQLFLNEHEDRERSALEIKEIQLKRIQEELDTLKKTLASLQQESLAAQLLIEKDRLLEEKQKEMEALKVQYENEKAELVKPALVQVNSQLDELKETNKVVMERLGEKENELTELRAQLNRKERRPKSKLSKDQEQQRRLNRLTVDLEQDRLLAQKLEELNYQLEAQKQKHEMILTAHAKAVAEKDRNLEKLKQTHETSVRHLEQNQTQNLNKLQLKYEKDVSLLNNRLHKVEIHAKTTVDDEVSKILYEFEQDEHSHHPVEPNTLFPKEHIFKSGQQLELHQLSMDKTVSSKLRRTGGPGAKFKWPAPEVSQSADLCPRDPKEIHVYTSSISNSIKLKQQEQDIIQSLELQQVKFKVIDVAKSELALQHMRKHNSKTRELPQIFMGGTYKCTYDDFLQAKKSGSILQLLGSSGEQEIVVSELGISPSLPSSYLSEAESMAPS
ncbi:hypothetical protein BY458DRAFT_575029 [Sporodiniella umbellata]|nr:hypothetical protein BY458DRAFT_575029 [Sporodiniella umbellata]